MTIWADFGFRDNPYAVEPLASSDQGAHLLVGREQESQRLRMALTSLDSHPTVEGPIGAGKTSLISVTRHRIDSDRTEATRFFDSGLTVQVSDGESSQYLERRVAFAIAQFFIDRSADLKSVGLDVPDTSHVDKWLNLPVFRGGSIGTAAMQAGFSHHATQSQGFDEAGFLTQVKRWLDDCFPSSANGGLICTMDNLELLETSAAARKVIESLRDGALSWPGLRWVLAGSSGVIRSAVMAPRLQGHLADPVTVEPLPIEDLPDVIATRIDEFAVHDEVFVPVEPKHFSSIYVSVKSNLRAALLLCQEFAVEIHTAGSYPGFSKKEALISEFLDAKAERYLASAGALPKGCWDLLDILASGAGTLMLSEFEEFDYSSSEDLRRVVAALVDSNLMTRVDSFAQDLDVSYEITPGGWLVWRSRRKSDRRLDALRDLTPEEIPDVSVPEGELGASDEVELGYRAPQVCHLVGITYRQLDYWTRTGLIQPSLLTANGKASQRLYSFVDVVELKVIKRLLDAGMSLKKIRSAVTILRNEIEAGYPLEDVTLISDGLTIHASHSEQEVVDSFRAGGGIFGIAVGPVQAEVEKAIHELFPETGEESN